MNDFVRYLSKFERDICAAGLADDTLGRVESVPVHAGKLAKTRFGHKMGAVVDSQIPFVINYYGYAKRSRGFMNFVRTLRSRTPGAQIKSVHVPVVNFASIKLEQMAKLAPHLLADFASFKEEILTARGFRHA